MLGHMHGLLNGKAPRVTGVLSAVGHAGNGERVYACKVLVPSTHVRLYMLAQPAVEPMRTVHTSLARIFPAFPF